MGKLIYSMLTSLDGYIADEEGNFDWATPDEELHRFINEVSRSVHTFLYGRRMYETMVFWETLQAGPGVDEYFVDWAKLWRAADKVVYSRTLGEVSSARTRLERSFDPEAVRQLKADAEHNLTVDGPTLAAAALRAGLVDEISQYLCPVIVGAGTRFFPDSLHLDLELQEERRFGNGVVYVRYRVR